MEMMCRQKFYSFHVFKLQSNFIHFMIHVTIEVHSLSIVGYKSESSKN